MLEGAIEDALVLHELLRAEPLLALGGLHHFGQIVDATCQIDDGGDLSGCFSV